MLPSLWNAIPGNEQLREGGTQLLAWFLLLAASTEQGQATQGKPGKWILVPNPKGSGCVLGKACYLSSLWGSNLWRNLGAGFRLLTGDLQLILIVVGVKISKRKMQRGGGSFSYCFVTQNCNYITPAASMGFMALSAPPFRGWGPWWPLGRGKHRDRLGKAGGAGRVGWGWRGDGGVSEDGGIGEDGAQCRFWGQ